LCFRPKQELCHHGAGLPAPGPPEGMIMEPNDLDLNYIDKWLSEASVKYKDGSQAVNLGLIITVFFKEGHTPEVRKKMVELLIAIMQNLNRI
jgi:hypothetical protein